MLVTSFVGVHTSVSNRPVALQCLESGDPALQRSEVTRRAGVFSGRLRASLKAHDPCGHPHRTNKSQSRPQTSSPKWVVTPIACRKSDMNMTEAGRTALLLGTSPSSVPILPLRIGERATIYVHHSHIVEHEEDDVMRPFMMSP